ncbi:MAG: ABC transporter permease [Acidimicrobiia bacterium]
MSYWSQTLIIARREFVERARSRVFLFTLVGLSVLVVAGIVAVSLIGGDEEALQLGVAGDSPPGITEDIEASAAALEREVEVTQYGSVEVARTAVGDGDVAAVLVDGTTIVSNDTPSGTTVAILTSAANAGVRRVIAGELGLTEEQVLAIVAPVQVSVVELDPEDAEEIARLAASFLSALVLLTTIMLFGQFVAMGIVEEKQNRVIEVILSKVRTSSLMVGKVLGIGVLGIIQIAALGVAVLIGLAIAPIPDVGVPDFNAIGLTAIVWLGLWFVLGYLVYSFLYATLGATLSRQEDMQSVAFIPALLILPAYFIVTISLSTGGGSALVRLGSFFPFWTPILMPFRINTGDAEWWEVALSIAIVVATIVLLVRVGSRVYRGAALRTGRKVSLKQAWSLADE